MCRQFDSVPSHIFQLYKVVIVKIFRFIVGLTLGAALLRIGYHHFTNPEIYDEIVPSYLGSPRFWTLFSGAIEMLLGLGLIVNKSRRITSRVLVFFFTVVYLANMNMWINDIPFSGTKLTSNGHIVRLLIQLILILTALNLSEIQIRYCKKK